MLLVMLLGKKRAMKKSAKSGVLTIYMTLGPHGQGNLGKNSASPECKAEEMTVLKCQGLEQ